MEGDLESGPAALGVPHPDHARGKQAVTLFRADREGEGFAVNEDRVFHVLQYV